MILRSLPHLVLIASIFSSLCSQQVASETRVLQASSCETCNVPNKFDPSRHKSKYIIGVLSFRGPGSAYAQHNESFSTYLTATAGQRFDPPIEFEMVPVDFQTMFDVASKGTVDYLYVSPSPFACVEAEYGAQSLISHISKRTVGGVTYELPSFAGVIATRADNDEINTIQDLKGKVVASAAISSFGGGQMQFRELQNAGLSYINDPKQVVFTGNQAAIVRGVLSGEFDVGFVRTDQIERTTDADGNLIDTALLKVLEPKDNKIDGVPFPFTASTQLYPEWNLAAMDFTPADVSAEVQAAMLALVGHSRVGAAIEACLAFNGTNCSNLTELVPDKRCDTTEEVAKIAHTAMVNGNYAGFRTTQSYIEIRAMLQDTAFISRNEVTNTWQCARPAELYKAIACPSGHFKRPEEDVLNGCSDSGLECGEGYSCICNPCIKAFDVDVYPASDSQDVVSDLGCEKMSLCGTTQQTKPITFRAIDNKKRDVSGMTVTVHEGEETRELEVIQNVTSKDYEFEVSARQTGILILEISLDGEQIPESPLRVQVQERDCSEEHFADLHVADTYGDCVCNAQTVSIGDSCIPQNVILIAVLAPIAGVVAMCVLYYIRKKTRDADAVWHVKLEEITFAEPPEIIGLGTFGLVLLGEYRGTKVAVKRVLSPKKETKSVGTSSTSGDAFASGSRIDTTQSVLKQGLFDAVKEEDVGSIHKESSKQALDNVIQTALDVVDERYEGSERTDDEELGTEKPAAGGSGHARINGSSSVAVQPRRPGHMSGVLTSKGTVSTTGTSNNKRGFFGGKSKFAQEKENFIKEMRLLSKLRHPCITTVMGAVMTKGEDPLLVMEYMDHGSLYDILHNSTMFMEGELVLHILRDIAQGIRFLHSADPPVIHGDLKSANILVDNKFRAKICDFGLSLMDHEGSAIGTPFWMAPELLSGLSANSTASDMYSVGVILYELYSRKDPYEGEETDEVLRLVCDRKVNKRPPIPDACPPKIAKLTKFLLLADPALRPSAEALDNRVGELNVANVEPGQMTFSKQLKKDDQHLARSAEDMLYQVFPERIADILKRGGKVEPQSHENITIFFSDIVGFTTIASSLSPMKISNLLDRLYLKLDSLARKYQLFKIETIGDAYMCAANLDKEQKQDHVKRIAEFSLEAVEAASLTRIDEDDPLRGNVQIRVGFHSGPVVSNVVGSLNPRFGIFGDTVNVSARMESTSEGGRIQCSERSAKLLMTQAPKVYVTKRGEIKIKGKGEMCTFWVHS